MIKKIEHSIKSALHVLTQGQQIHGGFLRYTSPYPNDFNPASNHDSISFTSHILHCLATVKTINPESVTKRAVKFLLQEKGKDRYDWLNDSTAHYPLVHQYNLNDACVALSALIQHNPECIDGKWLAKIMKVFIISEIRPGGPYTTWPVPITEQVEVDVAINSSAAFFLSLLKVQVPNVVTFTEKHIKTYNFNSRYYPSWHAVLYHISRWYRGTEVEKAQSFIIEHMDENGCWGNILQTALVVSALINFGSDSSVATKAVDYISNTIETERFKTYVFSQNPMENGIISYEGSQELTAAFCIEALEKFLAASTKIKSNKQAMEIGESMLQKKAIEKTIKIFSSFETKSRKRVDEFIRTMVANDTAQEITGLPILFRNTLAPKLKGTDDLSVQVCTASLCGWFAYRIYDDILDKNGGEQLLPAANMALRELIKIYTTILPKSELITFFHQIVDAQESANAWEQEYCRVLRLENFVDLPKTLPDYGNYSILANRSMGHALACVTYLLGGGLDPSSDEVKNLMLFFHHYIIAKQLNDDAHDWEMDLCAGHVNSVAVIILQEFTLRRIHTVNDLPKLQKIFWHNSIEKVTQDIFHHTKLARQALQELKLTVCHDISLLSALVARPEYAARQALQEKNKMLDFLTHYKKTSVL